MTPGPIDRRMSRASNRSSTASRAETGRCMRLALRPTADIYLPRATLSPVGKRRHQRLVEDPGFLRLVGDSQIRGVNFPEAPAGACQCLPDELVAITLRVELAG